MEKTYKIYSLASSENPEIVRYIGYTGKQYISSRLSTHINEALKGIRKGHKNNWIKKIKTSNFEIIQILIEDNILTIEEAKKKEIEYIKLFKSVGAYLVNGTLGGDGGANNQRKGYKLSVESCEKIRQANTGKKHSIETKNKLSEIVSKRKKIVYIDQYDLNGNFIKTWENYHDILKTYGGKIKSWQSIITSVKSSGKYLGFYWRKNKELNTKKILYNYA